MRWRSLALATFGILSTSLHAQVSSEEAISLAAILLMKSHELESFLGRMADDELIKENGLCTDPVITARASNVFNRLINNPSIKRDKLSYTLRVTDSSQVNAYALPGGFIYVNRGLMNVPGMTDDELAFVLAHELAHTNKSHGLNKLKQSLIIGIASKILIKDAKLKIGAEIAKQLYTAGRSRDNEREADKLGFEYVKLADFDARAPLAFMRRLETISRDSKDPFEQLFRTHPPTTERSDYLRQAFLDHRFGKTLVSFRSSEVSLSSGATPPFKKSQVFPNSTFNWDDPHWQEAYRTDTGWEVYRYKDGNPFYDRYAGQCTWFAYALRPDRLSWKSAKDWLEDCQNRQDRNYAVGKEPKEGAIACWKTISQYGHVGMVSRVYPDGSIEVWDCNWAGSRQATKQVKRRFITAADAKKIDGYIYWPNGQAEPPEGFPGYRSPSKNQTTEPAVLTSSTTAYQQVLIGPAFYLGDDNHNKFTIHAEAFDLNSELLASFSKALISIELKAIPRKDPIIRINGKEIGRAVATKTEWELFEFPFSISLLRARGNIIELETFIPDMWESYDDCEVRNVTLHLRR